MGLELWRRLGWRISLRSVGQRPSRSAVVAVAAVLAINRLCAPSSELAIEEQWFPATALDDLLGIEVARSIMRACIVV